MIPVGQYLQLMPPPPSVFQSEICRTFNCPEFVERASSFIVLELVIPEVATVNRQNTRG
jgi:hypothetical protein